jgi:hypothetical protein
MFPSHRRYPEVIFELTFPTLCREIGRTNPKETSRETSGVKNISTFVAEISEKLPLQVLPLTSVLLPHLGGEVIQLKVKTLRSTVIHDAKWHRPDAWLFNLQRVGPFRPRDFRKRARDERINAKYSRGTLSRC